MGDGVNKLFGGDESVLDRLSSELATSIISLLDFPEESVEWNWNHLLDILFSLQDMSDTELSEIAISLIEQSKQVNSGNFNG